MYRAMPKHGLIAGFCLALGLFMAQPARAQVTSLADDIIIISKGVQTQEQRRADQHLGGDIGGTMSTLGPSPGSGAPPTSQGAQAPGASYRRPNRDVLQAAASGGQRRPVEALRFQPPQALPAPPPKFLGALELPEGEDEGPPDGMTLDAAMDRLVRASYDLRTKSFEIPQARADVLTASLRANPLVFGTASNVPYAPYSPQRPGEVNFSATVIYPFDVSHKRQARTIVAAQAERVIEAQYQDAVRIDLDRLNTAFLDVIAARETVRYATASRDGLREVFRLAEQQLQNQQLAQIEVDRIGIQLDTAEIGVEQADVALREARHALGLLLAMPIEQAEQIEVRGTLRDTAPQPPADEELIALAYGSRPDLAAFRMGVQRARSDVRLAEAEKTSDLFLLYSPWELRNNSATGGQNAQSWSLAAFGSIALFNRNQGNIRRAQLNVSQTRTELAGLEQQVGQEVRRARAEYEASRQVVERLERTVLPRSRRVRDGAVRNLAAGETGVLEFLAAQREHNDVVQQYRDTLARHRRSMLRLNTAVGMRILP
jgi:cobalt-zinc-cadmium efflux system outer membrane protein